MPKPYNFREFFTLVDNPTNKTNAKAVCNFCALKNGGIQVAKLKPDYSDSDENDLDKLDENELDKDELDNDKNELDKNNNSKNDNINNQFLENDIDESIANDKNQWITIVDQWIIATQYENQVDDIRDQ
ncbi:12144_t:CDS:2, partial [Racocetra fulgida]